MSQCHNVTSQMHVNIYDYEMEKGDLGYLAKGQIVHESETHVLLDESCNFLQSTRKHLCEGWPNLECQVVEETVWTSKTCKGTLFDHTTNELQRIGKGASGWGEILKTYKPSIRLPLLIIIFKVMLSWIEKELDVKRTLQSKSCNKALIDSRLILK